MSIENNTFGMHPLLLLLDVKILLSLRKILKMLVHRKFVSLHFTKHIICFFVSDQQIIMNIL